MGDAPARSCARHQTQVDAAIERALAHRRRGQRLVAFSTRDKGGPRRLVHRRRGPRRFFLRLGRRLLHRLHRFGLLRFCRRVAIALDIAGTLDLELHQRRSDRRHLPRLAVQGDDLACHRRGHLHRRLVGHHVDHVLVLVHVVADLHMPGDDLRFRRAFADIGQLEHITTHPQASMARFSAAITRAGPGKYCHSKACG